MASCGVDDAYYEVGDYANTSGEVPYTVELLNFSSNDTAFDGLALTACGLFNLDDESGGFGQVVEVVKRDCGKHYAMKVMHKEMMRRCLGSSWRKKIALEKDLMASLNHPFLVNLSYAFQNPQFLVLVMDLVPGADLSDFVLTKKRLTADQVLRSKWVSEVCAPTDDGPTGGEAMSYFVGAKAVDGGIPEDGGFAINGGKGWSDVVFSNHQIDPNGTIAHAMGININKTEYSPSGRPFKVAHDGNVINDILT